MHNALIHCCGHLWESCITNYIIRAVLQYNIGIYKLQNKVLHKLRQYQTKSDIVIEIDGKNLS